MTLDEINELADALGIPGDTQILGRVPGEVGEPMELFTLEGVTINNHGQARLELCPLFDEEQVS